MIDSYNRKIEYARISLTNICNLRCSYCSQSDLENEHIPIEFYKNLIDVLSSLGIRKVRFTGGEPLLSKNIVEIIKYSSSKENIKDIAITSNGILLEKYIDDLVYSGLNRINLSLDTRNKITYKRITGYDKLNLVIKNILIAKSKGITIKINTVMLRGIIDKEIEEFLDFGFKNNIEIRFIELMPIGDNREYYNKYYISSGEVLDKLDCLKVNLEESGVTTYYRYKNKYNFGIISPISNHFCNDCNRIRITSEGSLRLCLHSDSEINLLKYGNDREKLYKILSENIKFKPEKHEIYEKNFSKSSMIQIGG